jgi:putative spermidine/putrescine transport system permease protein
MTMSWRSPLALALLGLCGLAFLYLLLPILVIAIAPLGATGYLAFPPQGLTLKWYVAAVNDPRYFNAMLVSLRVAVASSAIAPSGLPAPMP